MSNGSHGTNREMLPLEECCSQQRKTIEDRWLEPNSELQELTLGNLPCPLAPLMHPVHSPLCFQPARMPTP